VLVGICDVITCFKFGDDRFRGLASAECQILLFPVDFAGRPYKTFALQCEHVISIKNFVTKKYYFAFICCRFA